MGKVKINVENVFNDKSIETFLNSMKTTITQNEIFLTYILNFDVYTSNHNYERHITDFITYCYVLEVLTVILMKDEKVFQECLKTINHERENGLRTKHWRDYASLFQRAKIMSILPFIPDLSPKIVEEIVQITRKNG